MDKTNWLKLYFFMLAFFMVAPSSAVAWDVTIRNTSDYKVTVNILVNKGFNISLYSTADIPARGSHTFNTKAWCFGMATGAIYDKSGNQHTITDTARAIWWCIGITVAATNNSK